MARPPQTDSTPSSTSSSAPSPAMAALLRELQAALEPMRGRSAATGNWRWQMRQRLTALRDALLVEVPGPEGTDDGWLAARGGVAFRERNSLLQRVGDLSARVLSHEDVVDLVDQLNRLHHDISHHLQRLHDLAYDEVELELGGSD